MICEGNEDDNHINQVCLYLYLKDMNPYISLHGNVVKPPPYFFGKAKFTSFMFESTYTHVGKVADRWINMPTQNPQFVKPLLPAVTVTFAHYPECRCTEPPYSDQGFVSYNEVLFSVLVYIPDKLGFPKKIFSLVDYIWVDLDYTELTGREIFGMLKTRGIIHLPGQQDSKEDYSLISKCLKAYGKNEQPTDTLLVNISKEEEKRIFPQNSGHQELKTFAGLHQLTSEITDKILNHFDGKHFSMISLRQLRDIAFPALASYQSLISTDFIPAKIYEVKRLPGHYQLNLPPNASYPIQEDYGLKQGQRPIFASQLTWDFDIKKGKEIWNPKPSTMTPSKPKKIAVLGGGVSSITAVFEMTSQPDWKEKYDLTVYQMGWRLGGKCASGRNANIAQRIEEHGLHLWFGFYDNAFDLIKRVYKEADRPKTMPLSSWRSAFKPCDSVVLQEFYDNDWHSWPFAFPYNDEEPGDVNHQPTISEMVHETMLHLKRFYLFHKIQIDKIETEENSGNNKKGGTPWEIFKGKFQHIFKKFEEGSELVGLNFISGLIHLTEMLVNKHPDYKHSVLLEGIDRYLHWLWRTLEKKMESNVNLVQYWILAELLLTAVKGMISDGILTHGFNVINDIDFKAWLKKHGASDLTCNSCLPQAIYSLIFAGRNDFTTEAGTALRGVMQLGLFYRGAFYYRMQAGMGDTIFAPMYQVLKDRGVKFKFFHEVKELKLSDDKTYIEKLIIGRQVTLKDPKGYEPLFNVKGLPCWPSAPLYDQITEGNVLRSQNINLESPWANWENVEVMELEHGKDFDQILFGISIGSIPFLCKELVDHSESWRNMVEKIIAVPTQALQLWLKPNISDLGWKYWDQRGALLGTYIEPYDTYADMSDLLIRENWENPGMANSKPQENYWPNHIAYFCGPLFHLKMAPFSDHEFPARILAEAIETQEKFLNELIYRYWPQAINQNGGFNWDLLVDLLDQEGKARLSSQYSRVNISPSERYVLSVVNSTKYRIDPEKTEYSNLIVTGDWINTGINAGCVEAAVIAGKKAARVITGKEMFIKWEKDLFDPLP